MKKHVNDIKTNVMRILELSKIVHETHCYAESGAVSALDAATAMQIPPETIYKTLVTQGASGEYFVFVVPATAELSLKKAAKAVGDKSIEMIRSKDLLPLTGYVHGGCSPIGMKKYFKTVVDLSAKSLEKFTFSAGKIGYMVSISPNDLEKIIPVTFEDIKTSV